MSSGVSVSGTPAARVIIRRSLIHCEQGRRALPAGTRRVLAAQARMRHASAKTTLGTCSRFWPDRDELSRGSLALTRLGVDGARARYRPAAATGATTGSAVDFGVR